MEKLATKYFEKNLKILSFPRPLQHRFEIKKEEEVSKDEEAPKVKAPMDVEAPKTEQTDELLPVKVSPLQDDCFERVKLHSCLERIRSTGLAKARKVLEYIKENFFLLMCDEPLIRTEVCFNILKIWASKKTYVLRCLLGQNQLVPDFCATAFLRLCDLAMIRILNSGRRL